MSDNSVVEAQERGMWLLALVLTSSPKSLSSSPTKAPFPTTSWTSGSAISVSAFSYAAIPWG